MRHIRILPNQPTNRHPTSHTPSPQARPIRATKPAIHNITLPHPIRRRPHEARQNQDRPPQPHSRQANRHKPRRLHTNPPTLHRIHNRHHLTNLHKSHIRPRPHPKGANQQPIRPHSRHRRPNPSPRHTHPNNPLNARAAPTAAPPVSVSPNLTRRLSHNRSRLGPARPAAPSQGGPISGPTRANDAGAPAAGASAGPAVESVERSRAPRVNKSEIECAH